MLLFAGFAVLFLGWVDTVGDEYGKSADQISGGAFNVVTVNTALEESSALAATEKTKFESGSLVDIDNAKGVFSVMNSIGSFLLTPWTLLSGILINVLHVPPVFVGIILTILTLYVIFGIWRLVRAGD